jgi:archaellum component FlaC
MTLSGNNEANKTRVVNVWLVAFVAILIATLINWFMVTNLAASKTVYASEINKINNSVGHMNDSATSLTGFTDYQNTRIDELNDSTQSQFDDVNSSIADVNNKTGQVQNDLAGVKNQANNLKIQTDSLQNQTNTLTVQSTQLTGQLTTVRQTASNTQTSLDTLTTKVNGLAPGLQIVLSSTSSAITLTINSDVAQNIAFNIAFRPTSDMPTSSATMDAALAVLYTAPPITLTAGSSVRGDYTLYWNAADGAYHVGQISFITTGTALTAGTNTRTITYTTTDNYEILVTPLFLTGTSTGSW